LHRYYSDRDTRSQSHQDLTKPARPLRCPSAPNFDTSEEPHHDTAATVDHHRPADETCYFLVIEIDGPQHLADPASYRRDRSKDAMLQENGCHVLRFLVKDLSKHLDTTLDAMVRAVTHLQKVR